MNQQSRPRWPLGLIGMCVLVGAVELILSFHPLRFADTASLNWRLAVDDVDREAARTEVVCLGDSLTKIGVVPEVIRVGTGKRTYNFAMARAPALASEFVFRRLIDAGCQPSALVVDFKPSILAGRPRLAQRQFQEILSLRELGQFVVEDGSWKNVPPLLLGLGFPSIRYRLEIRDTILAALHGQTTQSHRTNRLALRNWTANHGNHFNVASTGFSGEIPPEILQALPLEGWKCHRINEQAIDRLFALAEIRSIPVYWIMPPLSPQLQGRRETQTVDALYTAFARKILARHPGVIVIDARQAGYEANAFADSVHLNGRGAVTFSHELALILNRPRDQTRWIDLPRFRDWPTDAPVEDLEQSRIAVERSNLVR